MIFAVRAFHFDLVFLPAFAFGGWGELMIKQYDPSALTRVLLIVLPFFMCTTIPPTFFGGVCF